MRGSEGSGSGRSLAEPFVLDGGRNVQCRSQAAELGGWTSLSCCTTQMNRSKGTTRASDRPRHIAIKLALPNWATLPSRSSIRPVLKPRQAASRRSRIVGIKIRGLCIARGAFPIRRYRGPCRRHLPRGSDNHRRIVHCAGASLGLGDQLRLRRRSTLTDGLPCVPASVGYGGAPENTLSSNASRQG
jgi:hypothetical protein